jgi:hypothetical protein
MPRAIGVGEGVAGVGEAGALGDAAGERGTGDMATIAAGSHVNSVVGMVAYG